MTVNAQTNDFSALAASRRSTRAFTDQEIPAEVLDAILADATAAPSWSNTRAFRVALAAGERAQRLREHYGRLFDEEIEAYARKAEDPDVEIPVPDGDFPVRKRYPDEVRPAQIEVAKLLYGIYGVERADIEGRNRVNRRNVTASMRPSWASSSSTRTCFRGAPWMLASCSRPCSCLRSRAASTPARSASSPPGVSL